MDLLTIPVNEFDLNGFVRKAAVFAEENSDIGTFSIYNLERIDDLESDMDENEAPDEAMLFELLSQEGAAFYIPFTAEDYDWHESSVPCLDRNKIEVREYLEEENDYQDDNSVICRSDNGSTTTGYIYRNQFGLITFQAAVCNPCSCGPHNCGDIAIDEADEPGIFFKPMLRFLESHVIKAGKEDAA